MDYLSEPHSPELNNMTDFSGPLNRGKRQDLLPQWLTETQVGPMETYQSFPLPLEVNQPSVNDMQPTYAGCTNQRTLCINTETQTDSHLISPVSGGVVTPESIVSQNFVDSYQCNNLAGHLNSSIDWDKVNILENVHSAQEAAVCNVTLPTVPYIGPQSLVTDKQSDACPVKMENKDARAIGSSNGTDIQANNKQQIHAFKNVVTVLKGSHGGPLIPQPIYKPHTENDCKRYISEHFLEEPIYFTTSSGKFYGITIDDAQKPIGLGRLDSRDDTVLTSCGPSISIRIEWPGYRQWSRQIPTRDFKSPPGPITKGKLAKNIAKCVERFIKARKGRQIEDDVESRYPLEGPRRIQPTDLILVSLHHVSKGSWQPHLRLKH